MAKSKIDKKNMVRYSNEPTYQEKVDRAKSDLRDEGLADKVKLALRFDELRKEEDKLNDDLAVNAVMQEAITQMVVDILDDEGITKFTLPDGRTFYQEQAVYVSVQDRESFYNWLKTNGLNDVFTVNYQTAASIVKERLETGQEVPPGAAAFLKTKLKRRKAKESQGE